MDHAAAALFARFVSDDDDELDGLDEPTNALVNQDQETDNQEVQMLAYWTTTMPTLSPRPVRPMLARPMMMMPVVGTATSVRPRLEHPIEFVPPQQPMMQARPQSARPMRPVFVPQVLEQLQNNDWPTLSQASSAPRVPLTHMPLPQPATTTGRPVAVAPAQPQQPSAAAVRHQNALNQDGSWPSLAEALSAPARQLREQSRVQQPRASSLIAAASAVMPLTQPSPPPQEATPEPAHPHAQRRTRLFNFEYVPEEDEPVSPVERLLSFENAKEYAEVFGRFVAADREAQRKRAEANKRDNISVHSVPLLAPNMKVIRLEFTTDLEYVHLSAGTRLMLYLKSEDDEEKKEWFTYGVVVNMPEEMRPCSILFKFNETDDDTPDGIFDGYSISVMFNGFPFDRMQKALEKFSLFTETALGEDIRRMILYGETHGPATAASNDFAPVKNATPAYPLADQLNVQGLSELNSLQADAIAQALRRPFTMIQGPPGTGKTETSAALVYHLFKSNQCRILVCASSNVAVDHLCEKINKTGLRVVRLMAKWRESMPTTMTFPTMREQIKPYIQQKPVLVDLLRKRAENMLTQEGKELCDSLMLECEIKLLKSADVICCTCSGAGERRLEDFSFPIVLIDEASHATEPELLIPLVCGEARQAILVGDHKQLGPVVIDEQAARDGYSISLFKRMVALNARPVRLEVQYRMHPCLSIFPSAQFYGGSLQDNFTPSASSERIVQSWPRPQKPLMFVHCDDGGETRAGMSRFNNGEIIVCRNIVKRWIKAGVKPEQIGIISPYASQVARIHQAIFNEFSKVEVATVDIFQGREKDYIIISCARTQGIGFLKDPGRLNVSITRARYGLVVVGDANNLVQDPLWASFIRHCKNESSYVDGLRSYFK